ncbi:MAG: ribose-phosphate diphosphokinase [Actinomycetota bacterium]|nr:ribose-phosphate diphosphokinase [Actinomycetota bacterium]
MELITKKRLHLISGRSNLALAEEIAGHLGVELDEPNLAEFANGEIHCRFSESVRGGDVFIIQSHSASPDMTINDSIMEQLIMVDAARRASAKRITVVCPFFGYARQDRKSEGREPITARLLANLFIAAGVSRMVSVDLHAGQIQGFFDKPVDHLTAMPVLVEYMRTLGDDLVVVSPDTGRVKVAERYASELTADLAIVHKRRIKSQKNRVEAGDVLGDVDGRVCVLIDDMIDTGGTIVGAAEQLADRGAKEVYACTSHGVFSDPAIERLENSVIKEVVMTNTLPLPEERNISKIKVLSVAPIIANALDAVFEDTSVSEIFGGKHLS